MALSPFRQPSWWSDPGPLGPRLESALSAGAGAPVCVWATQDKYPQPAATAIAAVGAVDMVSGIRSVTFTFSSAVTVGGSSTTTHTVAAPRWADVWGEGKYADYWCVRFDAGVLSSVTVDVSVTTMDGVSHSGTSLMGSGHESRVITFISSPTRVYADASKADDSGDGLSAGNAKKTLAAAFTVASTTADEVIIAAGTYAMPSSWSMGARSKMLRWIGASKETVTLTATAGTTQPTMGSWNSWESMTINFPGLTLRHASDTNHVVYRDVAFTIDHVRWVAGDTWFGLADPYLNFQRSSHIALIACSQSGGYSGPRMLAITGTQGYDIIVSGYDLSGSGTGFTPSCYNVLLERVTATDCAMSADGWPGGTHFDFIHTYAGVTPPIDNAIYRYCSAWGNGDGSLNYNWSLVEDGSTSIAIYNNWSNSIQSTQQVLQFNGNYSEGWVMHNTFSASDSDALRGIRFSNGTIANMRCVNNFAHAISQESTGFSGGTNNTSDYNKLTSSSLIDGAHTSDIGAIADAGFADASGSDFSITTSSVLYAAGRPTDVRFDFDGLTRNLSTPSVGAYER